MNLANDDFQNLLNIRPSMPKKSTRKLLEYAKKYLDEEDIPAKEEITADVLKGFNLAMCFMEELLKEEKLNDNPTKIDSINPEPGDLEM